jgi:hypothetical protein
MHSPPHATPLTLPLHRCHPPGAHALLASPRVWQQVSLEDAEFAMLVGQLINVVTINLLDALDQVEAAVAAGDNDPQATYLLAYPSEVGKHTNKHSRDGREGSTDMDGTEVVWTG